MRLSMQLTVLLTPSLWCQELIRLKLQRNLEEGDVVLLCMQVFFITAKIEKMNLKCLMNHLLLN
jgi:hypothetical protein